MLIKNLPVTDENKEAISLILDRSTEVWEFGGYPTISSYAGFLANAYVEEEITLEDIKQCSIADIMNDFKLEEIHNITSWREKNQDCEIMN